jgi:ribosomal protein L7/L12
MPTLTVAEALAEIYLIDRHVGKKQQLIVAYLLRSAEYRDPLLAEGGTAAVLAREMQSIQALHERKLLLRRRIQAANESTTITFGDEARSLADWFVWRREVSTRRGHFLGALRSRIDQARREAGQHARARPAGEGSGGDLVVHINEQELADETEQLEELLGYLDGQRALRNATMTIEVPADFTWKTGLEDRIDQLLGTTPAEKTGLTVVLEGLADPMKKINVINNVREITGSGLKEAKDLVEGAPRTVKENLSRDEAEAMRKKLEEGGARVTLR